MSIFCIVVHIRLAIYRCTIIFPRCWFIFPITTFNICTGQFNRVGVWNVCTILQWKVWDIYIIICRRLLIFIVYIIQIQEVIVRFVLDRLHKGKKRRMRWKNLTYNLIKSLQCIVCACYNIFHMTIPVEQVPCIRKYGFLIHVWMK